MKFCFFIITILFSFHALAEDKCVYRRGDDIPKFWLKGTMTLIDPNIDELHNFLITLERKYSELSKEEIIKDFKLRYEESLKFVQKENPEAGKYFEGCKPVDVFEAKSKEQILDFIQKYKNLYVKNPSGGDRSQTHTPSPSETLMEPTSYFRKFVRCTKTQTCGWYSSETPKSFYFPVLD